jgi:hypothetical protein
MKAEAGPLLQAQKKKRSRQAMHKVEFTETGRGYRPNLWIGGEEEEQEK